MPFHNCYDRKEDIDKNCTFFDNSKSIEMERGMKLETVVRCTKHEDTQCDNEHVDCSDISDICGTSTSTSITQDDNTVHKSVPDNDSSDCEQENVIIK